MFILPGGLFIVEKCSRDVILLLVLHFVLVLFPVLAFLLISTLLIKLVLAESPVAKQKDLNLVEIQL